MTCRNALITGAGRGIGRAVALALGREGVTVGLVARSEEELNGVAAEVASFTLGSTEVSPLTLANAYATVSAHGVYCKPRSITKLMTP